MEDKLILAWVQTPNWIALRPYLRDVIRTRSLSPADRKELLEMPNIPPNIRALLESK
jgi:hypothetical protein